jgi:hypothetical protein
VTELVHGEVEMKEKKEAETTYVVQSIISWTGRIVALLSTTADMWSHETVPCPFFSHPSKKQLRACVRYIKKESHCCEG